MEDFEKELRQALQRRPAPPSLKRRLMEQRGRRQSEHRLDRSAWWMRVAASLVLVAVLGGSARWEMQRVQEQRQGELARRQVMIALRITGHALNEVNTQLTVHDRGKGE